MEAFEALVATILERQGYWVRSAAKVELTKAEKRHIDRRSTPRWELDLIGYKSAGNELRVVECKSYLDSRGVLFKGFSDPQSQSYRRFKLFNDAKLRRTVLGRLKRQLVESGACRKNPRIQLCLAAAHIASENDRVRIRAHFHRHRWLLWDEPWLKEQLKQLSETGYQDNVAAVMAKILLRDK